MEKWKKWALGLGIGTAVALGTLSYVYRNEIKEFFFPVYRGQTFTVANWNLCIFGESKAKNQRLMETYAKRLSQYDIAFVQEIRDSSDSAFDKLCRLMQGYDHMISSRAGRDKSTCREQYGVLFKRSIKVKEFKDFNPDKQDRWERPPIKIVFGVGNYSFSAYNLHTQPSTTRKEIANLEGVVEDKGNVLICGDLNASGKTYNRKVQNNFSVWNWVISDTEDTTVAKSRNAYDRIILNRDAFREFIEKGIDTNVTRDVSDHYLVWVKMAAQER